VEGFTLNATSLAVHSALSVHCRYFEVYSPLISTRYGQVFWTVMDPTPLPPDIVKRFNGKTLSIVGYESDQVSHFIAKKSAGHGVGHTIGFV
jgi:hypothetical protein